VKAGSFRINLDHRQQRRERLLEREPVPELLLDGVPIIPWVSAPSTSSGDSGTSPYAASSRASNPICGPLPCEMISSCCSPIGARWSHASRAFVALIFHGHWLSPVQ